MALRRALNASKPPILVVDRDSLALDPAAIEVDVQVFERLAAGGSAKALDQAMGRYQGDLLEGFRVNEEPFEDWLRAERARLRQLAVETLTCLLALQSKAGETERAVHTAARLLALDPVQEAVHRTLMRLYARQGRRAEALRQYQVCVGVLQRELGVEPEAATRQIYHEILRRPQRTHAAAALRRPTEYRPLPAPPVIAATPTPLIGRDSELTTLGQADDRVHVAIYDRLIKPQRRLYHRRVGEALEALYAANLEPHYIALGGHFRAGEVWEKAVHFFRQAARRATARFAYREGVSCFDQALAALARLPESPTR